MEYETITQARGRRETLLSRSKRIIGKQLPNDKRSEDDEDESTALQNDVSKRRAQILKAQRTHRRRTQNYIQELEKEVLRLRAREAEMQSELESRSSSFSSRSQSAGLPSPSSSISSDHSLRPIKDISITIEPKGYAQFEPEYSCTIGTALEPTPAYSPLLSDFTARISDMSIKDAGTCTGAVCGLNAQAAINFVLGLERPCLPRANFDRQEPTATPLKAPVHNSGFAPTCTAPVSTIHSHQHLELDSAPIQVPVSEIERLLQSSRFLPLGPEMTPVQVWALLVDVSSQQAIDAMTYAALKEMLSQYMTYNSFGTTIGVDTLRQVLKWFFPWYPTEYLYDLKASVAQWGEQQMDELGGARWEKLF
ncbi:hypothetical protein OHC33_006937 [Knufia fluminis]|uniref:BZIP domain-containing protein n=1 Tax=Knufia fluminis TaxID=191047 RepID=A0AAN8EL78_9EURO|nr:hypothetical protein OHC33_006937 [Knufia fluminis]